jgi:hypothetical protein
MSGKRAGSVAAVRKEIVTDPEYQAYHAAMQEARARRTTELREDEAELRSELSALGFQVASVYDFVDGVVTPPAVVPTLVRHLELPHDKRVYEGIVRALSYSHLRPLALAPLRDWFVGQRDRLLRWVGANALASMATLEELADVEGIEEFHDLFDRPSRAPRDGWSDR